MRRSRKRRGNPVTIRGVAYISESAAAAAHGVTQPAIAAARRRGTLDNVGLGPAEPMRVCIRGVVYASARAAAAALGVSLSAVKSGLSSGRPDAIGTRKPSKTTGGYNGATPHA